MGKNTFIYLNSLLSTILNWRPSQMGPAKQSHLYFGVNRTMSKAGSEQPGNEQRLI